jgi:3-oxoacyl-[acyl-carrier-protein] synthase II
MMALIIRFICAISLVVASNAFQFMKTGERYGKMTSLRMQQERIVVTGLGVVSPIGSEPNAFFDNLCNGVSGISKLDRFDPAPFKCQIAGQINGFDPRAHYKSKKKIKQNDLCTHFAVAASHLAMADAGIDLLALDGKVDPTRVGVIVGSAFGGMDSFEKAANDLAKFGPSAVGPYTIPMILGNTAAGIVAMETGAKGPNFGVQTACATATHALGEVNTIFRYYDIGIKTSNLNKLT